MRKRSSRIVSKRLVCLRPAALALLGSAVFAGTAHAGADAEVPAPAAPPAEVQEVQAPAPPVPEVQEVAPPAPEVQEVAPPPPPAPKVPEVAPPPPPAHEVPEGAPPPEVQEVAPPPAPPHEAPEGLTPPASLAGAPEVTAPAPDAQPTEAAPVPVTQAAEARPEAPNSLSGPLIIAPTGGGPGASSVTSPTRPASVGSPLGTVAAQEAAALSCELHAVVRGGTTDSCFAGWLAARGLPSQSSIGLATDGASLTTVAAADAFSDGGHGGSAVVRPPAGPAPGPAPSGVSGGSAPGASGLALSAYLTPGDLLLGGPRAMRRLRLSCEQWRAACFVLIPERPG